MLKIRLKRTGRKGQPHYRIVIAQAHRARNSKSIEEIGYYNPRTTPSTIKLDTKAAKKWLANGAQPTKTVEHILVKEGVLKKIKRGSTLPQPKKKKKEADNTELKTEGKPTEKPDSKTKKNEPKKEENLTHKVTDSKE